MRGKYVRTPEIRAKMIGDKNPRWGKLANNHRKNHG